MNCSKWNPPENWQIIKTIESHAAGEPLRVIVEGFPEIPGTTMLEKRNYVLENLDHLRKGLMWEPRGHADMYGAILTEPCSEEANFGVLFLHNEGLSTMCGHGIIALTTAVLETGLFPRKEPLTELKIDTPAGLVTSFARVEKGRVKSVFFRNVPSFALYLDEEVEVEGIGKVKYDVAFGGAFYAFVNAEELGLSCNPEDFRRLIEAGTAIKKAVQKNKPIQHPFEKDLSFLYGTIFICREKDPVFHSRNVCVFAEGEVDRSPTGTGVSARLAIHFAKGQLKVDEEIVVESIIGTEFKGRITEVVDFGPFKAVIPEVEGSAYITGRSEFYFDPEDPLQYGFFLR